MNIPFVQSLIVVRPERRTYASALTCSVVLLAFDVYLYWAGQSWTLVHYESLAPLLTIGCPRPRLQLISAIGASLLFGMIAVLFFAFGLTWQLAAESGLFVGGAVLALLAWILPVLVNAWCGRWLPIGFLVAATCLLVADKGLSHDMLASAYMPHFLKLTTGANAKATPSLNAVYASLKHRLSVGHGGILIVFESLGVPQDKALIQAMTQSYPDFEITTPPFEGGSTVPAEIRYLCGINGNISNYTTCLPHLLPSRAMHGNSLSYFNRQILYRDMGFVQMAGMHELVGLNTCRFSYLAVCDRAIWAKLVEDVRHTQCRDFHYVLSIDSHFPYTKYARHAVDLFADLRQLLDLMKQVKHEFPGCEIVIAGDHPPPLAQGFDAHRVLVMTAWR